MTACCVLENGTLVDICPVKALGLWVHGKLRLHPEHGRGILLLGALEVSGGRRSFQDSTKLSWVCLGAARRL